ncbi:pirin family protein [Planctomycetes bacterium Pla163]
MTTRPATPDVLTIRRAHERGHANHGWLDANHTFSFASYRDPRWTHFGPLRVINQDRVQPRQGFGTHGHEDMEIVTYVLDGVLEHKDSMGNGSQMRHGEVQLMSAGTGVTHSEFNAGDDELHLLQMWVFPAENGYTPRYEQKKFDASERRGQLRLVVSPDGVDGSLTIGQDVRLFAGEFTNGERTDFQLAEGRSAWIHVARGTVRINGQELSGGDGAAVDAGAALEIEGVDGGELVMWDLVA